MNISMNDLTDIFSLFVDGIVIGGFLSALAFMIGYFIGLLFDIIRRA